jgi:hypothetical protein
MYKPLAPGLTPDEVAVEAETVQDCGRGLHSSTSQLNLAVSDNKLALNTPQ